MMGGQSFALSCRKKKWINQASKISSPEKLSKALPRVSGQEGSVVLQGKLKSKAAALQIPSQFKWGWLTLARLSMGSDGFAISGCLQSTSGWFQGLDLTFPGTGIATVHLAAPQKRDQMSPPSSASNLLWAFIGVISSPCDFCHQFFTLAGSVKGRNALHGAQQDQWGWF